jgi:uncharacterized protein DUF222
VGWQPGSDRGTGDEPEPGSDLLGRGPAGDSPTGRNPHLPGFAAGGEWDTCPPSAALAGALAGASGPEWRCAGATRDEMFGVLRRWQALESWAAAGKLGVLRALVREDDQPLPGGGYHDDLPDGWTKSLTHEVALALSMPAVSAERLMWLAWDVQARLPETGALLAAGELTCAKAKAVDEAMLLLSDEDAARAEAMIVPELPGKTYGQVAKLAAQAALTVDPEAATRRREEAEQNRCRVQLSREESGAAALSGRDLPTDQTLAAHASVCARAQQYQESGAFPDDTRMDQYRAAAYLDLLNGISAAARIASGQVVTVTRTASADDPGRLDASCPPPDDDGPGNGALEGGFGGAGPGDDTGGGSPGSPEDGSGTALAPRLADLVLPLATLLGLAGRPGEGRGLGPLDPALCRELATAATSSPWTQLCVTLTNADGIAIGHGCAKPAGKAKDRAANQPALAGLAASSRPGRRAAPALPARVNLTVTTSRLTELAAAGSSGPSATGPPGRTAATRPSGPAAWSFTLADSRGSPHGHGTWTLILPDGRRLTVHLEPVPTLACDHRHESHAYQPNDTLRHLVQVRDYECTFPPCSRPARESDFEHAMPYDKGGRTCGCNAGARSRACHQVKQSPGWTVTQPKPGWHHWQTPAGRGYIQGPKRYPT